MGLYTVITNSYPIPLHTNPSMGQEDDCKKWQTNSKTLNLGGSADMIEKNVVTDFSAKAVAPVIDPSTYVHPLAAVIGNVTLGKNIMVSPFASIRGDEGQPLFVGDNANVQDGHIHSETELNGAPVRNLLPWREEIRRLWQSCFLHQVQIHGPAVVLTKLVGMQSLVFKSFVGRGCVIEPGCLLMGVTVADGRYVPAGSVIKTQEQADALPVITEDYPFRTLNKGVLHVNTSLAKGYLAAHK